MQYSHSDDERQVCTHFTVKPSIHLASTDNWGKVQCSELGHADEPAIQCQLVTQSLACTMTGVEHLPFKPTVGGILFGGIPWTFLKIPFICSKSVCSRYSGQKSPSEECTVQKHPKRDSTNETQPKLTS